MKPTDLIYEADLTWDTAERGAPHRCTFCAAPSWIDPSDQMPPPDYCHQSDHGTPGTPTATS